MGPTFQSVTLRAGQGVEEPEEVVEVDVVVEIVFGTLAFRRDWSAAGSGEAVDENRHAEHVGVAVAVDVTARRVARAIAETNPGTGRVVGAVAFLARLIQDIIAADRGTSAVIEAQIRTGPVVGAVALFAHLIYDIVSAKRRAGAVAQTQIWAGRIIRTIAFLRARSGVVAAESAPTVAQAVAGTRG